MRIAVISAYYKEPLDMLRRCHDSVKGQSFPNVDHIMVSDGFPNAALDGWDLTHIRVPNHGDYGDTPRLIGAAHAATVGYDGVAFLDADNWYEPGHIEALLRTALRERASVVTATRILHTPEGRSLGVCTESDGETHSDTNCFLVMSPAFRLLGAWGFKDRNLSISGDRIFFQAVRESGLPYAHCATPTVNYVTTFAAHYFRAGETPPPEAKVSVQLPNGVATQITFEQWLQISAAEQAATVS